MLFSAKGFLKDHYMESG